MEEIVAKKANLLPGYIVVAILSAVLIAGGIAVGLVAGEPGAIVIGVAVGAILAVTAVVQILKFIKMPQALITYSDGKFHFPDGSSCLPEEISHILLKLTRGRYGSVASTGGMVLTVNGRKIELKYISKVKEAEKRISEICSAPRG